MPERKVSWIIVCLGIAKATLHDRTLRRRFIGHLLLGALIMMSVGLWLIDQWLRENVVRFAVWWAGCATLTSAVMVFALYDALAVIREEREKFDR